MLTANRLQLYYLNYEITINITKLIKDNILIYIYLIGISFARIQWLKLNNKYYLATYAIKNTFHTRSFLDSALTYAA